MKSLPAQTVIKQEKVADSKPDSNATETMEHTVSQKETIEISIKLEMNSETTAIDDKQIVKMPNTVIITFLLNII